ncbi:MAG: hypothetical protein ACM3PR_00310 [Bacteroidales bacterium]
MKTSIIKADCISPFINTNEAVFVKANFARKVSDMTETEAAKALAQIVNRAYTELGQAPAGSVRVDRKQYLESIGKLIYCDLMLYFPTVTIQEVGHAIKRGIRHEFGEYFGFNVIAVHTFVEKYMNSEERNEALRRQNVFLASLEEPEAPDREKQWKMFKQGLLSCYEIYKTKRQIIDFGCINYEFLVKAGQIKLSAEEKRSIYQQAVEQVKIEQAQEQTSVKNIFSYVKNNEPGTNAYVVRSKEISLANYFDNSEDLKAKIDIFYPIFTDYQSKSVS